jgi:hypothetical protein
MILITRTYNLSFIKYYKLRLMSFLKDFYEIREMELIFLIATIQKKLSRLPLGKYDLNTHFFLHGHRILL